MTGLDVENLLYFTALGAFTFSIPFYFAGIWWPRLQAFARAVVMLGLLAMSFLLVTHSINLGRIPGANLYEFVLLFSWGTVAIFWLLYRRYPARGSGVIVMLLAAAALAYAGNLSKEITPLMPALKSYWLKLHVGVAIMAYGSFAVSFAAGVLLLFKGKCITSLESGNQQTDLERLMNNAIKLGFPFMTLVLITGAVWAEQVWGRWWSWDPKEIWALVTWLIYAIYLHGKFNHNWQGKRSAWLAVVGFGAVLFTLLGVTWLLPGLHSYI